MGSGERERERDRERDGEGDIVHKQKQLELRRYGDRDDDDGGAANSEIMIVPNWRVESWNVLRRPLCFPALGGIHTSSNLSAFFDLLPLL